METRNQSWVCRKCGTTNEGSSCLECGSTHQLKTNAGVFSNFLSNDFAPNPQTDSEKVDELTKELEEEKVKNASLEVDIILMKKKMARFEREKNEAEAEAERQRKKKTPIMASTIGSFINYCTFLAFCLLGSFFVLVTTILVRSIMR